MREATRRPQNAGSDKARATPSGGPGHTGSSRSLARYQSAADSSPATQSLTTLQRRADGFSNADRTLEEDGAARDLPPQSTASSPGGLPAGLKSGIETLSGVSLDGVKVHRNSALPAQLMAHAYAQGANVYLGPGQEKHLPHEAWHVAQQARGRVQPTQMQGGVAINDDPGLEKEADVMGQKALDLAGSAQDVAPLSTGNFSGAPVQRVYAGLNDTGKARVDQQADADYAQHALQFELGMAQIIMTHGGVNAAVDSILAKVKVIVDAWAHHTSQDRGAVYEHEFGWPPGDGYYGAFEMTAANILDVFNNPGRPMRSKLKILYNAVRNNALSKWLKVAAIELDRAARGRAPRSRKVRSESQKVDRTGVAPRVISTNKNEKVTPGFAAHSGIAGYHDAAETNLLINQANQERRATGRFKHKRRDLFDHAHFSNALGWQASTHKANAERTGHASTGIAEADQSALTVAEVPDLTDPEIDLMLNRSGNANPSGPDRANYRAGGATKVSWSQGGEFYDINLGSESAKAAEGLKARMEAGISGSTDLMLHAGEHLGVKSIAQKQPLRLALAGWMMANRDHSFYEVFKAAEAYGVPFITDPAHPGSEYEQPPNLAPMIRADFAGILPNDGVLNNVFPASYQSTTWKDHLAGALNNPGHDQATVKAALTGHGVNALSQSAMTERDTAAVQRLDQVVAAQAINAGDSVSVKKLAVRRLKQDVSFVYLGNLFGQKRAERTLNDLLTHHHGAANVAAQGRRVRLRAAGLPDVVVDFASDADLTLLDTVRQNIEAMPAPLPPAKIDPAPAKAILAAATTLDDTHQDMVIASLIRRYHPGAPEPDLTKGHADVMSRITELEQVINMEKTTGTWYTWGPPGGHQFNIAAASLREATAAVPSTQGPGLYIGREITTSSGYGAAVGNRVLVVNMQDVATVNVNNATQMERVRRLAGFGTGVDELENAGLYNKFMRAEFLMRYGAGNFARLTTNRGVTLTMDVRQAPAAELRAAYRQPGWVGASKQNFDAQAQQHGLSLVGW